MVHPLLWVPQIDELGYWRLDPDATDVYTGQALCFRDRSKNNTKYHAVKPEVKGYWTPSEAAALLGTTPDKVRKQIYDFTGEGTKIIRGKQRFTEHLAIYGYLDLRLGWFRRAHDEVHLHRMMARSASAANEILIEQMHRDAIRIVEPHQLTS